MDNSEFQNEALQRLTRIETKITTVCGTQGDHEKRIRTLERGAWVAIGALVILQIVLGLILK